MRTGRPFPAGRGLGLPALLLLAGCATNEPSFQEQALAAALAANRASLEAIENGTLTATRPATTGAAPGGTAQLVDAPATTIASWFGQPRLRRVEGDAEIWLYQGSNCFLDLILYREAGALKVAQATARAAGLGRMTEGDCLRGLVQG